MSATAEFRGVTKIDYAYLISIFFSKERNGPHFVCFINGNIPELLLWYVVADQLIDKSFHLLRSSWETFS